MAKRKGDFEKLRQSGLVLVSTAAFLILIWLLFYGKIRATGLLAPILKRVPRDETGLVKITEDVLGTAVEKVKGDNMQKAVQKGSEFFETSQYAGPARDARDEVKKRIDETIESAKGLPAREVKHIQLEVCKEWLGEDMVATQGGER